MGKKSVRYVGIEEIKNTEGEREMIVNDYYSMGGPENAEWTGCPNCWGKLTIIIDTSGRYPHHEARCTCGWAGEIRRCWSPKNETSTRTLVAR